MSCGCFLFREIDGPGFVGASMQSCGKSFSVTGAGISNDDGRVL